MEKNQKSIFFSKFSSTKHLNLEVEMSFGLKITKSMLNGSIFISLFYLYFNRKSRWDYNET